ncbi:hypothetical protein BU24DRAFT_405085 [Aaosphaeria arxii CBS 175.79]|uniref:DNA2/NAM7 helicase-like C-terminal domain-containing protein n=1 Tax=Aaosphaeria arxii CBS 175.79 TaxID=1450172 RepID=A0A6A5YAE5_9PLEO|nr:uncharacterized protein BU24DRAFT_405085 [Aaosphaeria arxii CBS 175.79]KAF2022196.1 hypothetical protein BU24DRAFT_405085 [Aaosphaeria arxii CBS 175.79]
MHLSTRLAAAYCQQNSTVAFVDLEQLPAPQTDVSSSKFQIPAAIAIFDDLLNRLNSYDGKDITVLTAYIDQLSLLLALRTSTIAKPKSSQDYSMVKKLEKVTLSTIDGLNGEKSNVVLLDISVINISVYCKKQSGETLVSEENDLPGLATGGVWSDRWLINMERTTA